MWRGSEGRRGMSLSRRGFLKGSAGVAGGVFAARLAASTRAALGEPIVVPEAARTVEAGLEAFAAKFSVAGPAILLTRFGRFLSNKIFNCRVAGTPRSYVLNLGTAGATVAPGIDPYAHADVVLTEADWLGVLFGEQTGLAPALAGRFHPSRDTANRAILLGIVMFIFAHIPAGANPDPDLLRRIVAGAVERRGVPECAGEPETLEVVSDIQRDPAGEIAAAVLPPAGSVEVTRELAEWVAALRYEDIPAGAIASAKEQLISILGVTYAGSVMEPGLKTARAVRDWGEGGPATVIGATRYATSARNAAMVNSFLAQILEWEDWTFLAHSGASIVPVVLAAAEQAAAEGLPASGRDVAVAIVAANEVLARAGEVLTDVVGTGNGLTVHQIETTLAAGKLLGLDAPALRDALGIACTQPQMTAIAAWTADAKGMLTAWPAVTAMTAVLLARAGLSGKRTIVEEPLGYTGRVADIGSPRRLAHMVEGLGEVWRFDAARDELFTKRYPTDGFQLTSVDAILRIRNGALAGVARDALPGLVRRVEMRIPLVMAATASMFSGGPDGQQALFDRVADPEQPDWTYITLLFDGVWPVAAALADGELTHRQYRPEKLTDPVIRALAARIVEIPDLTMGVFGATARVEMADGITVHEQEVGCIENFDVREKMDVGAAEVKSPAEIDAIVAAVDALESIGDVRALTALL